MSDDFWTHDPGVLRVALPKGRMQEGVFRLLDDAGIRVTASQRGYRPLLSLPAAETKILKPQNIIEMLAQGSRDVGFAGADWVAELGADVVELLDTGLDPVSLVAAAPVELIGPGGSLPSRKLVVATEYQHLAERWIAARGLTAVVVRTYGATEVFPPEDADLIVDNTATGSTLRANGLGQVDVLMRSSTRMYASPRAMHQPSIRARIEELVLLVKAVLDARSRVMLEINVSAECLEAVIEVLPCMKEPTLAALHGGKGYAVKAAVPRNLLPTLIPELKRRGGTDIVAMNLSQIVV